MRQVPIENKLAGLQNARYDMVILLTGVVTRTAILGQSGP